MSTSKRWQVDISVDEQDDKTRADARLRNPAGTELVGTGLARRNPRDANVPEIGDELAVARALSDLAHKLLDATAADIEKVTHRPAYLPE
jgi:hypothetical protein